MADEKKNGTIYQELNKLLNLDGFGFQDAQPSISQSTPSKQSKIIIKGNSPEEIHQKGLELEQKKELQNKFFRTTDRGFQKALQYEAARLPAYIDYEGMEYYPIISSALDLFMEEATTIGVNGKMLNIYSNKERIKLLLEEFFYDIVNVNVNLPFWVRNTPIKYDSMIPLLDGTSITIKELSKKLKNNPNDEIWTYSIQDKTNKIVPGRVIWCDLTRNDSEILKVTFDDGTYIETTPDHEYMLRNGTYLRADELSEGISLMPFYTLTSKEANNILGYEKVYNPSSGRHLFTHRIVAQECVTNIKEELMNGEKYVTHHIDFNKKNNHPSNLKRMTAIEHSNYHKMLGDNGKLLLQRNDIKEKRMLGIDRYLRSEKRKVKLSKEMSGIYPKYFNDYNNSPLHEEHNKIRTNNMLKHWSNNEYREMVKDKMQLKLNDVSLNYIIKILTNSINYVSAENLGKILMSDEDFMALFKVANNNIRKDLSKSLSSTTLVKLIFRKTQKTYRNFVSEINPNFNSKSNFKRASAISKVRGNKNCVLNHKVLSIERLSEKHDVYCMEVVGKNNEQDRHNFPVCSKDENGNFTRNGAFLSNCKYGDNFVLLYGERKKGITHVKQLVNYEIERFERISNGKPLVKFKERMTGDEFNVFEIAHFRLLGDDKYLPYGSCLLSDTYIKTKDGIKEIKNILKGDVVIGFDVKTQQKIESNVLDVVCNGEKQTYKISTQHNFVKATDNHKIPIYDYNDNSFKEKFVSELKIGDGLIINNYDDYNEQIKINKSVEIKEHKNRIYDDFVDDLKYIPDYIDEDFAKLFGFLLGDGGVNAKRPYMVYFAYGVHDTINKKYINLLEKFSNKNIYLRKNKIYGNGIASAVVNSKSLATILKNMEFAGDSRTKRIPKWLFSTSFNIRKAFLEGIQDADGSVSIDKWNCKRFQIELANYSLINDTKLLAQSLGYKTGSINKRKKRENVIILKNKVINVADSYALYFYESKNEQTIASDIKKRLTNEFIIEKIKSIELDEIGFVYDIHVDNENHNFYANGVVVHNSILNKVRRVFRQLVMAEDAMLTYRIMRAGEKKVFKIDVGNIDEDDIEDYIFKVATKFKKVGQVAPNNGQMDYRFNILGNDEDYFLPVRNANTQTGIDTLAGACLALDTKIELLDGRSLNLQSIINEFNEGKDLWTYSTNPENGLIVPSPITWAGITRKNTEVLKITLDNGESITCTPDHKFPTKFNGKKEAKDLFVGESMWAFNKKNETIRGGGKRNSYEMIYDHSINDWVHTHRMVANYMKEKNLHETFTHKINTDNQQTIHHKDFNRYNNNPQNLCFMNSGDHIIYHRDNAKTQYDSYSDETKESHTNLRRNGVNSYWNLITNAKLVLKKETAINNSLISRDKYANTFKNNPNRNEIIERIRLKSIETKNLPEYKLLYSNNAKLQWKNTNLAEIIREKQSIKYSEKLLDLIVDYYNELGRIDLILKDRINIENSEWLTEFNILNPNNKQLNKMTEITRNNIDKLLKHFGYSNWNDFKHKVPCYNHKIVSIEYLSEKQDTGTITVDGNETYHNYHTFATTCGIFTYNSNLDAIQDIEYLRDNLFVGLGVPKPFLSFQDAAGAGKNMAQYDIRFAKKINRIQQAMIQELNKMAMIHLYLLGYSGEDLNGFELTLTNPSTQLELQKSELMRDKAQSYTELTRGESGIAAMSHTNAKRLIFNMSDKEIIEDLKQQKMEKVVMQELADAPVMIKKSGLFTDIDKRFAQAEGGMPSGGTEQGDAMPPAGGAMGGAIPPAGGAIPPAGGAPTGEAGGEMGELPPLAEGKMTEEEFAKHVERMVFGNSPEPEHKKIEKNKKIINENNKTNDKLNQNALTMISEIDQLLGESKSINTQQKVNEATDVNFEEIGEIDLS
jgi:intein/homing endonuclease